MSRDPTLTTILREHSLRVTRPRLAVLEALQQHPHTDTETVYGVVRGDLGEVSRQAVYDVLRALTTAGLVRRIQPSGSVARYELRDHTDPHHHVVCRSCGAIDDVDAAGVPDTACLTAPADRGFAVDEVEVVFWGTCPACSAAAPLKHPQS